MGIDAIVTAGDGRAARRVFKKNKALLDVGGRPIIRHIVETLQACGSIDNIVVVGPRDKFEEIIGDTRAHLVPQKRSLAENGWEGFLQSLPEYRDKPEITGALIEKYYGKHVLFLSGDIPLLCVEELEQFISRCDMDRSDYIAGITSEETLREFGPRRGRPGIKMATFHTREGNFRQNNLHMARPFVLLNSIDLVLKVYEYRYQKELVNIGRAILEIVRLGPGKIGKTLVLYLLLQISAGLTAVGLPGAARVVSYAISRHKLERLISEVLGTRFRLVETTIGGAALDVDNEKDFMVLSVMYRDWVNLINRRTHHLA
jgi:CTP:molybdopterin cytidylyltransferase MocA